MVPCHSCHVYGICTSKSKKVWRMLKSHQLVQQYKRGFLSLMGKAGSHYVILLYFETLLQVLLGIYCKRFYWIPLFTILLFYVFEVGKAKSATQSVLMILTLNGLFQFFPLPLGIPGKTRLHPQKLHIIVLHPSEILRPKTKTPGNSTKFFLDHAQKIPHCF